MHVDVCGCCMQACITHVDGERRRDNWGAKWNCAKNIIET